MILGPNGSGKTTLLTLAGARLWPSSGSVEIFWGVSWPGRRPDLAPTHRIGERIGHPTAAARPPGPRRRGQRSPRPLESWWHPYADEDWAEADRLLDEAGFAAIATRPFGVISEGERQHVLWPGRS